MLTRHILHVALWDSCIFVHGGQRFSVNRRVIQMIIPMIQMVNNDRPVQSVFKFYNTNTNHEHMGRSVAQWLAGWTTVRVI